MRQLDGRFWSTAGLAAAVACAAPAHAQTEDRVRYDLPAQPLSASIRAVGVASGRSLIASSEALAEKTAPPLVGEFTVDEALRHLLRDSGLTASASGASIIISAGGRSAANAEPLESGETAIVVTGSRIRDVPVASPVITLNRESMRDSGLSTLADAVRRIPQSFGGGQNPGIGFNVPEANGADVGGGSSVNLRGLGSDATLTLLNGHRLAYSAVTQSIDISAIPFGAVDRIEIVPDGASALFGSDAVAGVVNVILRRDFDGLETLARLGASTDGGNFQHQYALTGGHVWKSGGFLLAYEYGSNDSIEARQRSYAAQRTPGLTLYPALRRHSAALTGHQALTDDLTFAFDGLFNKRWSDSTFPLDLGGDLTLARGTSFTVAESFGLAPSLDLELPGNWSVSLSGTYGEDKVDYGGDLFFGAERIDAGNGFYRNIGQSAEVSGNGRLLPLPAGFAKLAIGAGYRRNSFQRFDSGGGQNINRAQSSYYAFGELNVPLVSPAQDIGLVHQLNVSAAARFERYPGVGDVATPKLGLIYAPSTDVDFKASWGRSFRAPTLFQQFQPQAAFLVDASTLGDAGAAPGSTALLLLGGNADLEPERSTNWSATLALHPRALPRAELEISYFSVRYTDRIVTPIAFTALALSDPAYSDLILRDPSEATQAALLAGAATFANLSGADEYDPAQVVAIVDNSSVNAGSQRVHGVDALARYRIETGRGTVSASLNASYLRSRQQLTPELPPTQLAGILFNPPRFRARATAGWENGPLALTVDANYIGSVRDVRGTSEVRIDGMTPIDLTARYRPAAASGPLRGLDIILSIQNIFNDEPSPIATTLFLDTPYDSTNYSPVGRFISLSVSKTW